VGKNGLTIGEIQECLDIPASTLAHHLDFLKDADLIYQERKGRSIFNYAKFDYIELLGNYLLKKCCVEQGKIKRKI
jgi:DNA-binding transcriptional ArsR family regulator